MCNQYALERHLHTNEADSMSVGGNHRGDRDPATLTNRETANEIGGSAHPLSSRRPRIPKRVEHPRRPDDEHTVLDVVCGEGVPDHLLDLVLFVLFVEVQLCRMAGAFGEVMPAEENS